jgi:virginiamycin B lyase
MALAEPRLRWTFIWRRSRSRLTISSTSESLSLRSREVRQLQGDRAETRRPAITKLFSIPVLIAKPGRACSIVLAASLLVLALPSIAGAYIYWPTDFSGTVSRSNLDGSGINRSLTSGGTRTAGVAVDGSHLYWVDYATNTIGRSKLDGSEVEQSFISGANHPIGVAVDGAHIYWANNSGGTIGRADLNGSTVEQDFITAPTAAGVAVNGTYIYWTENLSNKIGRAKLDGSEVEHGFITGAKHPYGVAVNAAHIYWSNEETGTIARANLNGSEVEQSFINPLPEKEETEEEENEEKISGESRYGIAIDSTHIYWANDASAEIGRANLDGSGFNPSFIPLATAFGVAVDSGSPPASQPTTTTVACAPDQLTLLGSTTCRATVSSVSAATGAVAFSSNGAGSFAPATSCSLAAVGATQAACMVTYTPTATGSQTITAAYGGDEADGSSSAIAIVQTASPSIAIPPLSHISQIPPSNAIALAKPKYNKKTGTAALIAIVPGPGRLVLSGAGIQKLTKNAQGAGKVTLTVKPSSKTVQTLKKAGKAKVIAKITFIPTDGAPHTESVPLTLKG